MGWPISLAWRIATSHPAAAPSSTTRIVIAAPMPRRRAASTVAMLYTPTVRPTRTPSPLVTALPS